MGYILNKIVEKCVKINSKLINKPLINANQDSKVIYEDENCE